MQLYRICEQRLPSKRLSVLLKGLQANKDVSQVWVCNCSHPLFDGTSGDSHQRLPDHRLVSSNPCATTPQHLLETLGSAGEYMSFWKHNYLKVIEIISADFWATVSIMACPRSQNSSNKSLIYLSALKIQTPNHTAHSLCVTGVLWNQTLFWFAQNNIERAPELVLMHTQSFSIHTQNL